MQLILQCVPDGHALQCSSPVTGATLLRLFGAERLVLVSLTALKGGDVYRRYRPVSRDGEPHDLSTYAEIHDTNRRLLARITPV